MGAVNDLAFANPNRQLCVVTCGDDQLIKVINESQGVLVRRLYCSCLNLIDVWNRYGTFQVGSILPLKVTKLLFIPFALITKRTFRCGILSSMILFYRLFQEHLVINN